MQLGPFRRKSGDRILWQHPGALQCKTSSWGALVCLSRVGQAGFSTKSSSPCTYPSELLLLWLAGRMYPLPVISGSPGMPRICQLALGSRNCVCVTASFKTLLRNLVWSAAWDLFILLLSFFTEKGEKKCTQDISPKIWRALWNVFKFFFFKP